MLTMMLLLLIGDGDDAAGDAADPDADADDSDKKDICNDHCIHEYTPLLRTCWY
jgi:hypothetical protein